MQKYENWKDISVKVTAYDCHLGNKLYVATCLYSVGISPNNYHFEQLLRKYINAKFKCTDCSWWKGEVFDPYENIHIIDAYLKSNSRNKDWVAVRGTWTSQKGLLNAFLECTKSNHKEYNNRPEIMQRGGINVGEKVMLYNTDWKNKYLLPA